MPMPSSHAHLRRAGIMSVALVTQTACFPFFGSRSDTSPPPEPHGTARDDAGNSAVDDNGTSCDSHRLDTRQHRRVASSAKRIS